MHSSSGMSDKISTRLRRRLARRSGRRFYFLPLLDLACLVIDVAVLPFPFPGGPSHIDRHNVELSRQLDRADGADVRGVLHYQEATTGSGVAQGAPLPASERQLPQEVGTSA